MDLPSPTYALNILKEDNPWDVVSMFEFAYFCCPECETRTQSKQEFVSHASTDHPWVSCFLST